MNKFVFGILSFFDHYSELFISYLFLVVGDIALEVVGILIRIRFLFSLLHNKHEVMHRSDKIETDWLFFIIFKLEN